MLLYILRSDSNDPGIAFPRYRDAAKAAASLQYAEIVRANLHQKGTALHCALFNRDLGDDARVIAVVRDGSVLALNQKLGPQDVFACPAGHVRGVIAQAGTEMRCGTCSEPLTSG